MSKKIKIYGAIFASGLALLGTVLATRGVHDSFLFHRAEADSNYHLTLSSANKYANGETTKLLTTDSGNYQVEFAYHNCSVNGSGHVTINNEGTVKNTDHILSISSLTPVFTASNDAMLKFRASYDGNKWGEYATLTSSKSFLLDSHPYYIELKAFGGAINLTSLDIAYACSINGDAEGGELVPAYVKVKSALSDYSGKYLIVRETTETSAEVLDSTTGSDEINTNANHFSATIDNETIISNETIDESSFLISKYNGGYTIGDLSGNYFIESISSDKNGILWTSSKYVSQINISDSNYQIISSDGLYLRYNNDTVNNATLFRYYKNSTTGEPAYLYKYNENGASSVGIPKYPTGIEVTDSKSSNYHTGDVFDNFIGNDGMCVKMNYSDGKSQVLTSSNYSLVIKSLSGSTISSSTGFTTTGTYNVTITDKTYGFTYTYQILVANNPVTSITLNTNSLRLTVGDTAQLSVISILPVNADDKSITWTSSDISKATVDSNGLVTAIEATKKVVITATANGGSGVTASCNVSISSTGGGGTETVEITFDFTEISGFDDWSSSYEQHEVEYDDGEVIFWSADHNTSTITNMPVTKGSPVEYIAPEDTIISSFKFDCEKWGSNNQTITLNTSTDYGENYTTTSTTSSTFTISGSNLENQELNALKFTFSSTSKQIGIKSLTVTLVKEAAIVVPVSSLSVSPSTKSILIGDDFTITPTILPTDATNKKVVWSSSDDSVATVVEGTVTGIAAGKATITATVKDTAFSASCVVTVNNRPVTSLVLSKTEAEITVGGKDLQLTATINSDATIQTISWESSDETVLTVDSSGKVHAVAVGSAIVTATADGGITATCSITVNPKQEGGGGGDSTVYTKVTDSSGLTNGQYLIVCEDQRVAFDGAHEDDSGNVKLDAVSNTISVSITDETIESNETTDAAAFTFDSSEGSFLSSTDLYIGNTANSNSLGTGTSPMTNTVSIDNNENAVIKASGGSYLRYNAASDQTRFRYFKSSTYASQQEIQLYKLGEGGSGSDTPPTKPTLSSISVTGAKTSFTKGDTFVFGGVCTATYSNGSEKGVTPTSFSGYDMNTVGQQTVTVSYTEDGKTETTTYKINVEDVVITLSDITVTPGATTFSIGDPFSKPTVMAKYSDGSTLNVTNSASITGYNAQTAGKQTITVSYTEGGITKTKTYTVEVIDPEEAATGSATIVPTDLQTAYPGSEVQFTKSNMTFGYNTVANMSSNGIIQFKKQVGYVRNVAAIAGLRSIEVIVTSGKAFTGTLFSGTTADDLTHSQTVEESGTYFIDSGDKFFKLQETGSNAGYLDSITVNYSTKKVNPTSVYFDQTTMDMTPGETAKLLAKFTPEDCNENMGLTWKSSDTNVATVSNGTITAKAKGTTTITATSTYNSNFKATCVVTVKDIAVTSVSLDTTSTTLSIGATQQLYATINPSNATNQNVTWSSMNSSIASVSTTGLVTANAVGSTTIKVTTADGNKVASCSVTVEEQKADKWTIMIYMCGADLESGGGYASSDIMEILDTDNKPNDVNIIIQTGGSKAWKLDKTYISGTDKIDPKKTQRWHVDGEKIVLDSSLDKANFGSSSTLQSFYTWGTTSYPAEKTGVIFWNHGGGVDGVCWDENYTDKEGYEDYLTMAECKQALSGAFGSSPSKKLEWIGYDACLMQVQEIADYNSKYFNYMVASEESESGYGWDYDEWLPYLYGGSDTGTILKQICYTFIAEQGTNSDQTLSYLNLAYMSEYKTAWENFASALSSTLSNNKVTKKTFQTFVNNNVKFYAESGYCGWGNIDAKDFVNKVAANSSYNPGSTYTNAVLTAFSKLVAYSRCGSKAGNSYGLCCVYRKDSKVYYTSDESSFTNWISFNSTYGG